MNSNFANESNESLIAAIFAIAAELEARTGRKVTPDGHLVGGLGEAFVIAKKGLVGAWASTKGFDAMDGEMTVQIKTTTTNSITLSGPDSPADLLAAVKLNSDGSCDLRYYGPAAPVWAMSEGRRGQWTKAFSRLPAS